MRSGMLLRKFWDIITCKKNCVSLLLLYMGWKWYHTVYNITAAML